MKKNIIKATLVAAFALLAGYNVYASQKTETLSDLALANVEALADPSESLGSGTHTCYDTFTSADWFHTDQYFVHCYYCVVDKGRDLRDKGSCTK